MRLSIALFYLLAVSYASAKEVRDTIWTRQNDKVIVTYNVSSDNDHLTVDFSRPRVIPSEALNKACKGELDKLKVVVFDRIGDFGKVKWAGLSPSAFMVPNGLSYDKTSDGFYILGESQPVEFQKKDKNVVVVKMPLYIAVYDKKQNYRIISSGKQSLHVSSSVETGRSGHRQPGRQGTQTERIAVTSSEEMEAENSDITSALSSIEMVKELLSRETDVPFSQILHMEIDNLRTLKNQIKEPEVVGKINEVLLMCDDKERELKEARNQSALAVEAQEKANMQQQKREAEAQQKASEEKARQAEEKQQKRTFWMIIGGVLLAVVGFIGNAIFKHFRDLRNQKSIMEMQESIARQAEHEAGRRSREIIRNKAHKAVNKGRDKLRDTMSNGAGKRPGNNKRRSI